MKYKITRITNNNGKSIYWTEYEGTLSWVSFPKDGYGESYPHNSREEALQAIDTHHGNKINSTTIEYIIK